MVTGIALPRIAVVGVGFMGQLHAAAVKNLGPNVLTAVVDRDEVRAQEVSARFDVPARADVGQILDDGLADAVIIALPDHLHVEAAQTVLSAGIPLLLEKPAAHTLTAAETIVSASEQHRTRLMIGHVLRFDPRYAMAARAVSEGSIGEVLTTSAGRLALRTEGMHAHDMSSLVMHLGVHDIDIIQWVSGRRITRVFACGVSKLMPRLGYEQNDAITSTLELDDGSIGTLFSGWNRLEDDPVGIDGRLEIAGTHGIINIDVRDHGIRMTTNQGTTQPDALHWPEVHGRIRGNLAAEVRHFCTSLATDAKFVISAEEALSAVAVGDAVDRSIASGEPESVRQF